MGLNKQKLAREIENVCVFGIPDHKTIKTSKAMHVLNAILKTIIKGVERDGFVTVPGLGRFYKKKIKGTTRVVFLNPYVNKIRVPVEIPERYELGFTPIRAIRRSLDDEVESGV